MVERVLVTDDLVASLREVHHPRVDVGADADQFAWFSHAALTGMLSPTGGTGHRMLNGSL